MKLLDLILVLQLLLYGLVQVYFTYSLITVAASLNDESKDSLLVRV
jgi:hypothetical protein